MVSASFSWPDEMGAEVVDLHATPRAEQLYRGPVDLPVSLGVNEARAWFGTVRVRAFSFISGTASVAAITLGVFAFTGPAPGAIVASVALAIVAVASGTFVWLRVSVDRRGLRVMSGLFKFPLKRIHLDDIESVRVTMIRPTEWGGWSYRMMPGRSAVVVSGGPGITIHRRDGHLFAVTIPEPELPAALSTTLTDR